MTDVVCNACGDDVEDGNHWVHSSVFHHNRDDNPEDWSRDDPENEAYNLCPSCGDKVTAVLEGRA